MDLYACTSYQQVLTAMISQHKSVRGYQKQLSEAAGCHTSYLSQVRCGKAQLTPDHAAGLASFWQFDEAASDYFLTLVQLDRASSPALKTMLRTRINRLKREHERLTTRLKEKTTMPVLDQVSYYNTWRHAVIHMAAMIPGWQSETILAKRLSLPVELVQGSLLVLERLGLVTKDRGKWEIGGQLQHLSDDSPLLPIHQANFRELARARTQLRGKNDVQYSAVYALSEKDNERLRRETLDFIEHTRQVVIPSKSETVACLVCDFFEL